uniref:Putative secreted protein n=1 Tax=Ixodes scapularis TaxID=6945 RepID=A0A4D5RV02_IXOSC
MCVSPSFVLFAALFAISRSQTVKPRRKHSCARSYWSSWRNKSFDSLVLANQEALLEIGIQPGSYQASYGERATKMKVAKAQVKALESSKMSHKKRKMEAVAKAQRDRAEEGVTYAHGAF